MAIYKTYFDVPDGAMCRPLGMTRFFEKSTWVNLSTPKHFPYSNSCPIHFHLALGQWETEETKITISRSEFIEKSNKVFQAYLEKESMNYIGPAHLKINYMGPMLVLVKELFPDN